MWYFYKGFEAGELDEIINDLNGVFDSILNERNSDYPSWISSIKGKKLLNLFEEFQSRYLSSHNSEKQLLIEAYNKNRMIKEVCNGVLNPISYTQLLEGSSEAFKKCIEILKKIQDYLYSDLPKLNYFRDHAGTLGEYYSKFYDESIKYVCPFCGIDEFLTSSDKRREHFDHYIPKARYPFVSLLRENLYPMCSRCNSSYKGTIDITENYKVFYPFTEENNDCELSLDIRNGEVFSISINSAIYSDQIDTWNLTWDVKNRVKNHVVVNLQGWLSSIQEIIACVDGIDYETALRVQIASCTPKFQKQNFVKKAVLECL